MRCNFVWLACVIGNASYRIVILSDGAPAGKRWKPGLQAEPNAIACLSGGRSQCAD